MTGEEMVERFQCPGCVVGSNTKCGAFEPITTSGIACKSHVLGTRIMPYIGNIALGFPKGFCRPGPNDADKDTRNKMHVRLWVEGTRPDWDRCNVPVWAMEQDGCLFVRTYLPRLNDAFVDVIEGGTLALVPAAIDVGQFYSEID